jgi:hypothetical protein
MRFAVLVLVLFTGLLAGCSTGGPQTIGPKADFSKIRHIYVRSASNDSAQLDVLMADELKARGYDATSGVRTMQPLNAELTLSYDSRWEWDFRQYLIEIRLTVSDARSERIITTAREFHPGITSKTPPQMVHELIGQLFPPVGK